MIAPASSSRDLPSGSVGLESGADYLRGCFFHSLDFAIAREVQDWLVSPLDQTATNLPFDASGTLIPSRSQPKNIGVGVANGYQGPRTLQVAFGEGNV